MSATHISGRFAPSPTGPLHMGSLLTALASYLDIKQMGGRWLVRIDDLDPARQDPNAVAAITQGLATHGLHSDATIDFQSHHQQRYVQYLQQLQPQLFYCSCARKTVAQHPVYPGNCRAHKQPREDCALRIEINPDKARIDYHDHIQGPVTSDLSAAYGDFIVKRRDQLWAYNFATSVDDGLDFSHVLRGQDLAAVTPPQMYIMDQLNLPRPQYSHIPVLCFADGSKLSKQSHAPPLDNSSAAANLASALTWLGMQPPRQPLWQVGDWLQWGLQHWQRGKIPQVLAPYSSSALR